MNRTDKAGTTSFACKSTRLDVMIPNVKIENAHQKKDAQAQ